MDFKTLLQKIVDNADTKVLQGGKIGLSKQPTEGDTNHEFR